jgi:hypothetical protein
MDEEDILVELSEDFLEISKSGSYMFDNIDSFVALSRENTSVKEVVLYPFDSDAGDYEFWDKVGQVVGNLMELQTLTIHSFIPYNDDDHYDGDEAGMPNWEIITRALRYLRRKVELWPITENSEGGYEESQGLARAIHGHPMISEFSSHDFTFESLVLWCSTLATLPYLERVRLTLREPETEDQRDLVNPEPLTELLRAPALRCVRFDAFYFTNALCHATANALEEGSSIIDITFDDECSFPDGGRAIIANALKRNVSVTDVKFLGDFDEPFCITLTAVLICNSTLQNLSVHTATRASCKWFSSMFLSLGMNTTLKSLAVRIVDKFGDELCAAIRNGLAKNSTLEKLSLYDMHSSDDDGAVSARKALSFLRTNSTLKSLTVSFVQVREESYVSAFQLESVKMTEDNPFLKSLAIKSGWKIKFEELISLVSALQRDTTLKTLDYSYESIYLTDDEVNQLVSILIKNYGLERLVPDISCADDGTVMAILRLNGAGRRYLIEDGSSISKGVEVLSAVNDDINCVFLHLLENPGLCNRRAATTTRSPLAGANLD